MSRWFVIAVLLILTDLLAAQSLSPALKAVVDTERAFARASVEHGQREAFLTYLADDGITFSPAPGRGTRSIRKTSGAREPEGTAAQLGSDDGRRVELGRPRIHYGSVRLRGSLGHCATAATRDVLHYLEEAARRRVPRGA